MKTNHGIHFVGKHYLVLGLAKSGFAVAKLLLRLGAKVTVNEYKQRHECSGVEELENEGITVICGGHPLVLLEGDIDMIVKNPGIPFDIPFLVEAEKRRIPIATEIEIAYLISKAPIIGITGSNGKTTTTTLVFEMLKESECSPLIAGNIGTVFCEVAEKAEKNNWIVAELSSFQLLGTQRFKPQIAVLLNIFDAHLDYHHTKEHYVDAKANLFANQTEDEIAILNYDQDVVRSLSKRLRATVIWFSLKQEVPFGSFVKNNKIVYRNQSGSLIDILPIQEVGLMGQHNLENCLAAVATAISAGANVRTIQRVLRTFTGVTHRLQLVRTLNGVVYYNDSKATNSIATKKSVESFSGSVILIAGGLDRGDDFMELKGVFHSHLKALIVYGQNAQKISKVAKEAGVNQVIHVDNVSNAVTSASSIAGSGDTVLLSPASASWDQFKSFEERGDMFIESVHKLR